MYHETEIILYYVLVCSVQSPKRHAYLFTCEALSYMYTYSVNASAVCHHWVMAVVGKKELTYFIYQSYHDELIRST